MTSPLSLIGEEAVATVIQHDSCCASMDTYRYDELGRWPDCTCERSERSRAAISAHLAALKEAGLVIVPREPTEAMWQAWRSVNCKIGEDGMEEFTYFAGDYGNWLACHLRMMDASPTFAAPPAQNGDEVKG